MKNKTTKSDTWKTTRVTRRVPKAIYRSRPKSGLSKTSMRPPYTYLHVHHSFLSAFTSTSKPGSSPLRFPFLLFRLIYLRETAVAEQARPHASVTYH